MSKPKTAIYTMPKNVIIYFIDAKPYAIYIEIEVAMIQPLNIIPLKTYQNIIFFPSFYKLWHVLFLDFFITLDIIKQIKPTKNGVNISKIVKLQFSKNREYKFIAFVCKGVSESLRCPLKREKQLNPFTNHILDNALKQGLIEERVIRERQLI